MTDEKILDMYWERSEDAITETSKKYGHYCFSIAYNILRNSEDSEECVNDTFLNAWKTIPPRRPANLATYLGKIVRNLSLNKYEYYTARKRQNTQVAFALDELLNCVSGAYNSDNIIDSIVIGDIFDKFLESLDEINRKIFISRYWYFFSIKEISVKYHLTESYVKVSLFRSRSSLKIILKKEGIF